MKNENLYLLLTLFCRVERDILFGNQMFKNVKNTHTRKFFSEGTITITQFIYFSELVFWLIYKLWHILYLNAKDNHRPQ